MHHPTKYNSTQLNRGTWHPQTRARTRTHTTPHNTPSMTCSRFGPTRGRRSVSSAVLDRDFSTAGRLIKGSRSSLSAACAEMVVFINGNIEHMPTEVPALSTEQATLPSLQPEKAEVAALSAGEAEYAGEAGVDAAYDEYAREAGSASEEGVNAGCGDSTREGSD